MGKFISVIYRYRPIRKLDLSAVIGIGRYGKKLIDCTLISCNFFPDFMYFEKTNNSEGDRPGMLDG